MTTTSGAASPTNRARLFERALQLQNAAQGVAAFVNGEMGSTLSRIVQIPIPEMEHELQQFVAMAEAVLLAVKQYMDDEDELKRLVPASRELQRKLFRLRWSDYVSARGRSWAESFMGTLPHELEKLRAWFAAGDQLLVQLEAEVAEEKRLELEAERKERQEIAERDQRLSEFYREAARDIEYGVLRDDLDGSDAWDAKELARYGAITAKEAALVASAARANVLHWDWLEWVAEEYADWPYSENRKLHHRERLRRSDITEWKMEHEPRWFYERLARRQELGLLNELEESWFKLRWRKLLRPDRRRRWRAEASRLKRSMLR